MGRKIDYNSEIMKAQSLEPAEAKKLLNFLLSSCFGDDKFKISVHAGIKSLEKAAAGAQK
jgi:hypothetical protein